MFMKRVFLLALSFILVFSLSGATNIAYALDEGAQEAGKMTEAIDPDNSAVAGAPNPRTTGSRVNNFRR